MSSSDIIINAINQLRKDPVSQKKKLETVGKALERAKRRGSGMGLSSFVQELAETKPLKELKVSEGLMASATKKVIELMSQGGPRYTWSDEELVELIKPHVKSFSDPVIIVDHGDTDLFLARVMISDHDPKRVWRNALLSEHNQFIGCANRTYEDDELSIVIVAEKVKELDRDYGEWSELKEIFDLLDMEDEGFVNPTDLLEAFRTLRYDERNPNLYQIFEELERDFERAQGKRERDIAEHEKKLEEGIKDENWNEPEPLKGVDFDAFKNSVIIRYVKGRKTKKQLKAIFNLFIDDKDEQSISISQIRRITHHLEEDINPEELKRLMNWSTLHGSEMSFDEFYEVMSVNPSI